MFFKKEWNPDSSQNPLKELSNSEGQSRERKKRRRKILQEEHSEIQF